MNLCFSTLNTAILFIVTVCYTEYSSINRHDLRVCFPAQAADYEILETTHLALHVPQVLKHKFLEAQASISLHRFSVIVSNIQMYV